MKCRRHGARVFGALVRALASAMIVMSASVPVLAAEFSIVNASSVSVRHLYVSPCGTRQWGPDQLVESLPPSRLATISGITPGCYDIQFIVDPWNNCVIAGAHLRHGSIWKITHWTVFGSQSGDCSHVAAYVPAQRQPWIRSGAPSNARRD